jgi:REP element-mobilizing transposase RayT
MRHAIYLHIVWTTLGRDRLIDAARASFLRRHLRNVAREELAAVLAIGMVSTHLHLLFRVHPACPPSRLVQRWKGGSAMLCRRDTIGNPRQPLRWARGYSVTSVHPRSTSEVKLYLSRQAMHHPHEAIPAADLEPGSSL